ncbi:cytochrome P450 2B19-like isoform X1 [Mytilus trossulus]|uniref:cytochrome P450 2B19-like isoform X1 n=1 Tax=Mytilus trossulus TaxID=6551 RepID=UPI003006DB0B
MNPFFTTMDFTTILIFIIVLMISYMVWNQFFTVQVDIPGPKPWPILGNLPHVARTKDPGKKMLEFREKYGDMVFLRFGSQPALFCFGYEMVKEALVNSGEKTKFRPNWLYLFKKMFPKTGIFFSNGQPWSEGRKLTSVAFKDFGVGKRTIDERISEEVQFLVDEFSKHSGEPIQVNTVFPMATSNIISSIVFGSRFTYDDEEFKSMLQHIYFFFKNLKVIAPQNFFPILDKIMPWSSHAQINEHLAAIRTFVKTRIEKQRDSFDPENIRNFLDLYLEQERKPESIISEGFIFQVIADLYEAGTDTTSTTLTWCMLFMLNYPDVQKKCREEVMKVIGDGRYPSAKDRASLPYTMATIREIQRTASVAPIATPHAVLEDTIIAGKLVPKQTIIYCHLMSVLNDTTQWTEPEKFRPERFLGKNGQLIKPDAFCPFSMGPRSCIGQQLATNEVFLFFTSLIQRFNFVKVNTDEELSLEGEQTGITRQPKLFKMYFEPI